MCKVLEQNDDHCPSHVESLEIMTAAPRICKDFKQ